MVECEFTPKQQEVNFEVDDRQRLDAECRDSRAQWIHELKRGEMWLLTARSGVVSRNGSRDVGILLPQAGARVSEESRPARSNFCKTSQLNSKRLLHRQGPIAQRQAAQDAHKSIPSHGTSPPGPSRSPCSCWALPTRLLTLLLVW